MATGTSDVAVPTVFLEGLALDVSILEALLKRHRTSHGRTLYYRRMSMAWKSVQRTYNILDAVSRLEALQKEANQYSQEQKRKCKRNKRGKQQEQAEDEQWSLETATANSSMEDSKWTEISGEMKALIHTFTLGIREIISRIHHASQALFLEISRGFFLPFCTVGVSALARIRSMLLEIGRRGLTKLKDIQSDLMLTKDTSKILSESDYELYMNEFLDSTDPLPTRFGGPAELDQNELLASLGLAPPTKKDKTVDRKDDKTSQPTNETTNAGLDEQDFGEAVVSGDHRADTKTLDSVASTSVVESNMAFVESFQKKKKKRDSKKSEQNTSTSNGGATTEKSIKKRKSTSISDTPKKDDKTPKKKKKKSKKKSKGNFFDDLFDS